MSFIPTLQTNYAQLVTCICRNKTNETDFTPQMRFIIHSVILFPSIACLIHLVYSFTVLMPVTVSKVNMLIANFDLYCQKVIALELQKNLEYKTYYPIIVFSGGINSLHIYHFTMVICSTE